MADKAVVFGITSDLAFAAGAALASILAQDPGFDATVVINHDGLAEDQQAAFGKLWPDCRFYPFDLSDAAARLRVPQDAPGLVASVSRYSPLVLAKLDLPALLAEFERVLWLDADILVRAPLTEAWDFDCLAWRPLPKGAFARRASVLEAVPEIVRSPEVPLLNGGVIGLSRGFLDRGGSSAALHDMARLLAQRTRTTQLDEMSWYLTAASLGLPVTALPMRLNHPVAAPGAAGATIIHAIGAHKFWNATPLVQFYPDWAVHHARWIASGGTPYAGPVALAETHPPEMSDVLKAAEARAFWLGIFDDLRPHLPKGMVVDLRHDRPFLRLFLHGRPAEQHLRLVRVTNSRRLGLEAHLPAGLADGVRKAILRAVPGARHDKGSALSIPIANLGPALAAADAILPEV